MSAPIRLPDVNAVTLGAPFRWLGLAWSDLWKAWPSCLAYGLSVAAFSAWLSGMLIISNMAFWALSLSCGFVFIAPLLAMGPYEAGRRLEAGEAPHLGDILLLPRAFRADVALLGLALLVIFFIWTQIAQIVYGLSTYQIHRTLSALAQFALDTADGRRMIVVGSVIGGGIAFLTFCLVAVSAPMLLDRRNSVFEATVTSVRAVTANFAPMVLWAVLIAALIVGSALTGFLALVVVFPWLGLATWRAYRELVRTAD